MPVNASTTIQPFLKTCADELKPELLASFQRKSTLWHVLAIVSKVAISILVAGAIIAGGLLSPALLLPNVICCIVLISSTATLRMKLSQYSSEASERAQQLEGIGRHFEALGTATPADLQWYLGEMGVLHVSGMHHNDARLATLKPLIARHRFWEGHIKRLENDLEATRKEIAEGPVFYPKGMLPLQCKALGQERVMLEAKVKTAFINAVLRRPEHKGSLEDLGCFSWLSGTDRAIALATKTAGAAEFFTFGGKPPSLQFEEVKQLSVPEIGSRLYAAMGAL